MIPVTRYLVTCRGVVTDLEGALRHPEELENFLELVMDELRQLEGSEHDLGAVLARGEIRLSVLVEVPTPLDAVITGSGIIRTAIHAAGARTPDWSLERLEVSAEEEAGDPADLVGA